MTVSPTVPLLYPRVDFPEDPRLSELPKLFDPEWVWHTYHQQFGKQEIIPHQIRIRQFSHSLGRTAVVSYMMEWQLDDYIPAQHFAARMERGKSVELFRYPEDRHLPGLNEAARPETALRLVNRHVLAIGARRASVKLVRYRPGSRAVLRHGVGKVRFYARVMRPAAVSSLLAAWALIGRSDFVVPRLAGYWEDGGVVWMSEIPGKNLRRYIRRGNQPNPAPFLDGLETLWHAPASHEIHNRRPFNLSGAYYRAKHSLKHKVRDHDSAAHSLHEATKSLDPFIQSWQPSGMAHNDFYDDQMLILPDGRVVLVDLEEVGPGDPMLDVGNFLAHLRWASRFRRKSEADASGLYCAVFRHAALRRFHWHEHELALREAVCLFRICTNAIRHPRPNWYDTLNTGLSLVNEILG